MGSTVDFDASVTVGSAPLSVILDFADYCPEWQALLHGTADVAILGASVRIYDSSDNCVQYRPPLHGSVGGPSPSGSVVHVFDTPGVYRCGASVSWRCYGQIVTHDSGDLLLITVLDSGGIAVPSVGDPHAGILKLRYPSSLPLPGVMA